MTDSFQRPDEPPLVMPQGPALDASALHPGVRRLSLDAKTIPEGELAKLSMVEELLIWGAARR